MNSPLTLITAPLRIPDPLLQLGLTTHTWASLHHAITTAIRTPGTYNIGLSGHGLAWEAWLDEFLDKGVGDRFWPGRWSSDRAVIREVVKIQVLSIALGETKVGRREALRAAVVYGGEIRATEDQEVGQDGEQITEDDGEEPDEAQIGVKTRAAMKNSLPRKRKRDRFLAIGEAKLEVDKRSPDMDESLNEPYPLRPRRGPTRTRKLTGWVAVNEVEPDTKYEQTPTPVGPKKRGRKKASAPGAPDNPIELPSDPVIDPENTIPTPCPTPITPAPTPLPLSPPAPTPALVSSPIVLETRLTTSPKLKFIYTTDTPSLSRFLERVRQKWMLSETQRVCSIEIEMGDKVFDVDLGEERDWRVVMGIMEKWGEGVGVGVVIEVKG